MLSRAIDIRSSLQLHG